MKSSSKETSKPQTLVEGLDFTIENGFYIFTAQYLKKRGYCCENGCRNCPYGFKKRETR